MTGVTIRLSNKGKKEQRANLLSLVQEKTIGEEWNVGRVGWKAEANETVCEWDGVECYDDNATVVKIDLSSTRLAGTLPPELGRLPKLKHLLLSDNELEGSIPDKYLTQLFKTLETLDLHGNQLDGTLAQFSSSSLKILNLSHNRFQGQLPFDVGRSLPSAIDFDVSHNGLTGTIPRSFGELAMLEKLDLSENMLDGTIPHGLGNLKQLKGLFLDHNKLIGTIPASLARSDNILVQIFLETNMLSGTVPIALADLQNLKDLYIDENKFTGTLPLEICDQNLNEDFFVGTEFDTPERDGCESIVCPVNTMSEEGIYPCYPCGVQSMNPYLGKVGRCYHENERLILTQFYDQCGGPEWKNATGWGLDNVAQCDFKGITCNNAGHVVNITLVDFGVSGTLPEDIGFLRHLRALNLADNEIEGQIPASLRFAPLEQLDISGNKMTGYIPPMLCLTGDINGNGVGGGYTCDFIACSPGFSSPTGYATINSLGGIEECTPCSKRRVSNYLGSKSCYRPSSKEDKPKPINPPPKPETDFEPPPPPEPEPQPQPQPQPKLVRSKEKTPADLSQIEHQSDGHMMVWTLMLFGVVAIAMYIKKQKMRSRSYDLDDLQGVNSAGGGGGGGLRGLPRPNFSAFPRPNFDKLPRPSINGLKVMQAKVLDRIGRSQAHDDGPSVMSSQAVQDGLNGSKEMLSSVSFVGSVVGDEKSVASNMSHFSYTGDGADDDDMSIVCRSGYKKRGDEESFTVVHRRVIDDHPPVPRAEPDLSDVSSYGSSDEDESDDEDKTNKSKGDEESSDESEDDDEESGSDEEESGSSEEESDDESDEEESDDESDEDGEENLIAFNENIPASVEVDESEEKNQLWLDVADIS